MPRLFGIDIAQVVASAIGQAGGLERAALVVVRPGVRDEDNPTRFGEEELTRYPCQALVAEWSAGVELVNRVAAEIVLIGKTLAGGTVVPAVGHRIELRGVTYTIADPGNGKAAVEADPALATYTCRVRAGT